ncbi:probable enoyl-CoA hydratase 2, mitochondrial isoform X1 [Setaria italica]|uniref:probable enoyl-CoA hydratase 2, mitochondrial isoform X1 n=1 Tax=Setaria italica TaxID=4555 RepID=UPI000350F7F8|nr:probable enoyl-CoA hydratase 2, mitochondrial isoform X1 [Setaria italica]
MRSPRGLLAVSGYLAGRHARAASVSTTGHHSLFFARAFQILAQPEPVRLQELSAPDSGILELRLERPEVKNAINWDVMRRLRSAIEKIQADATAKVVLVVSSVPGAFCAGADLKVWTCPERKLMSSSEVGEYARSLRSTFSSFEALPIPTIAVIEGAALGGGLELALSCDLRICGENAELGLPETGLAIIPGAGGTQRLPRIVGGSRAKELIFTGRRCDAAEAVMMGLANYCVPAGEAYQKALDIAREIMQKGPLGIRMAKKAINQGTQVADMSSALAVEGECYEQLLHTQDRLEALAAFAEKRKPVYTGK